MAPTLSGRSGPAVSVDAEIVDRIITEACGADDELLSELSDPDALNDFVQRLVGSDGPGPFGLPEGAEAVAYYVSDADDPGFVFALRPRFNLNRALVNVATFFVEAWSLVDNGIAGRESYQVLAQRVTDELAPLVPAYERMFGGGQAA